ncbi:hypothetical protein [Roseovarius sp. THAF8]|uniref:hypothetical protein n=1 Tax=Roseovarius sp. THAF8 TaxID=2587846 RepID=UPI001562E6F0|nr:hypothetical protein [Roseovarius sp. THAF8]
MQWHNLPAALIDSLIHTSGQVGKRRLRAFQRELFVSLLQQLLKAVGPPNDLFHADFPNADIYPSGE